MTILNNFIVGLIDKLDLSNLVSPKAPLKLSYPSAFPTMPDFGNAVHAPCRREGISEILCYLWSKEFLEVGKERLADNTKRQASSQEVNDLCQENEQAKQAP